MIMNTNADATAIDANAIINVMHRPAPSFHNELHEVAAFILNDRDDHAKYWAEELGSGRLYIEINPAEDEGWDAALSVFHVGYFMGDVLLRGN